MSSGLLWEGSQGLGALAGGARGKGAEHGAHRTSAPRAGRRAASGAAETGQPGAGGGPGEGVSLGRCREGQKGGGGQCRLGGDAPSETEQQSGYEWGSNPASLFQVCDPRHTAKPLCASVSSFIERENNSPHSRGYLEASCLSRLSGTVRAQEPRFLQTGVGVDLSATHGLTQAQGETVGSRQWSKWEARE